MRTAHDVAAVYAAEKDLMTRVPSDHLMAIAAQGVAHTIIDTLVGQTRIPGVRVVALVGSGNNGGDALFAAAHLAGRGMPVTAITTAPQWHEAGAQALTAAGGRLVAAAEGAAAIHDATVVIDGIVGIGARGPLPPAVAALVEQIPDSASVFAVDIPSGVDPDTGAVPGTAVTADVTVTFGTYKQAHFLPPGRDHCGVVELVDIGLTPPPHGCRVLDLADLTTHYAEPTDSSYKYSHGVPAVCAGSSQYPGAPHMVVGAARHAGVGMVRLWQDAAPEATASVIERFPDVVGTSGPLGEDPKATAWVIGPGLGTGDAESALVAEALATDLPVVVDADALTLVAHHPELRTAVRQRTATTVLTPHVAEFARLGFEIGDDRLSAARTAAAELECVLVLKGAGTVISGPTGDPYIDTLGPSALATAGTGDALSGLVGAALSQHPDDPVQAVAAAVGLHGLAARIASRGGFPMTAWDLVGAVGQAVATVREAPDVTRP